MDYFEEMKNCYDRVTGVMGCTATRKKYLVRCQQLMILHPELKEYYTIDDNAYYVCNRIKRRTDNAIKQAVQEMILDKPYEVTFNVECLKIDEIEHFAGLYIVGDIKYDPTYGKVHLIKCGGSDDIYKRMKSYTTHNPMFFHDFTSLPCDDWKLKETIVQHFLSRVAIGVPPFSREWYIVPEETYFKLCDLFKDKMFFSSIASGKWLF